MSGGAFAPGFGLAAVAVAACGFRAFGMLAWGGGRGPAGLGVLPGRLALAAGGVMLDGGSGGERGGRRDEQRGSDQSGQGKQHQDTFRVAVG
jgi:hypothetical protein